MSSFIRGLGVGFVAGFATGVAAPTVVPAFVQAGRPFAKAAIKQVVLAIERAKVQVARASEAFDDFMAEIRFEVDEALAEREPRTQPSETRTQPAPSPSSATAGTEGATAYS